MDMWEEAKKKIQDLEKDPLVGGDVLKTMDTISIADYWRRRYEEEHAIWEARFNSKLEEVAAILEKLRQSEAGMRETKLRFETAEKEKENERRTWEEKLRVRELENQLLRERAEWEAKLRIVQQQAGLAPGEFPHSVAPGTAYAMNYPSSPAQAQSNPRSVAEIAELREALAASENERKKLANETARLHDILEKNHTSIERQKQLHEELEKVKKDNEAMRNSVASASEGQLEKLQELLTQISSLETENGKLKTMVNILTSDVKRLHELYEKREDARLEEYEIFARGYSHRLRNYMGIVSGTLQLCMSEYKMVPELKDQLILADQHMQEMLKCMEEMISLSRKTEIHPEIIDLNSFLGMIVPTIKERAMGQSVQVEWKPKENLPSSKIDNKLIGEAVEHVVANAFEALSNGGSLVISTDYDPQNLCVIVKFADTGAGINDVHIKKVFQPYFSTKKGKKGMGLTIVQRVMDLHHGSVSIESVKGKGTTATLSFPCAR